MLFRSLLLSSLGFPGPITLSLILGVHGLAINPLLSLLSSFGPTLAHSHFSITYIAHDLLISLFSGSFKPIYPLKAHLFISWVYDPLFLPLGLNGFSIHLPTLFCPHCWASPLHLDFQNGHQQQYTLFSLFDLTNSIYCNYHGKNFDFNFPNQYIHVSVTIVF